MTAKSKNLFVTYVLSIAMIWSTVCIAELNDASIPEPIKVKAVVDPRVELMGVIFHLAGNHEYNQCKSKQYMKNLNEHFKEHRGHPAVKMAAELRKRRGVSYDAVMGMAVHIKDINSCAELVPFEPRPAALDNRWRIDEAREFLAQCRSFTKDTNFGAFLEKNRPMYDVATRRLQSLIDTHARLEWFDEFFGTPSERRFNLVVSILNGSSSYGTRVETGDKTQIYSILGTWQISWFGWGNPTFSPGIISTIVHEFGHSYCNPIVDRHMSEFEKFGRKFYSKLEKKMKQQAYGTWQTMMYESLVRACEVRYAVANDGPQRAERIANYQIERGFLWTKELSELLAEYENQRDKYPTLESFVPRIIRFFDDYTKKNG